MRPVRDQSWAGTKELGLQQDSCRETDQREKLLAHLLAACHGCI
jgi:hypothetical protein